MSFTDKWCYYGGIAGMVGVAIVMVIAAITRQGASVWMGLGFGLLLSVILFFRGWEAKDKAQSKNQGSHDNKA